MRRRRRIGESISASVAPLNRDAKKGLIARPRTRQALPVRDSFSASPSFHIPHVDREPVAADSGQGEIQHVSGFQRSPNREILSILLDLRLPHLPINRQQAPWLHGSMDQEKST